MTAAGKVLVASPSRNSDLYWALSGGGGGTYAIVLSMTVKAYPELKTTSATLSFTGAGVSDDIFWRVVREFITGIVPVVDTRGVAVWQALGTSFSVTPITIPGGIMQQLQRALKSTIDMLKRYSMPYSTYNSMPFPVQEYQPKSSIQYPRISFLLVQFSEDESSQQYHRVPTGRTIHATISDRNQHNWSNWFSANNHTVWSNYIRHLECFSNPATR